MHYNIVATGSKGNAVIINGSILIDCGVTFKTLESTFPNICLVLLTHKHKDHFNSATVKKMLKLKPWIRFGCCEWMKPLLCECNVPEKNIDILDIEKEYSYGRFKITPVMLFHSVPNCGYRIFCDEKKIFYATDTCHLDGIDAKDYDLYMIEANYETEEMQERINKKIKNGGYIYEFEAMRTHLSKADCDKFIEKNANENSHTVYLHQHKEK